ncbi:MAG: PD-(D/E)XK nuclease-like domain-containing protein [Clostridia bacterium]|nr:PD-(D/E)XK nuclease-like domain-containing protein [Clostridia bacterium]
MILTNENYFSRANQMKYMGASQFKSFCDCEARTMAELRGEYIREVTNSLLVGSYVDAYFEGTLDLFKAKHPDVFTKTGVLKADFKQAEYIIERIERSEMFMGYLSGSKQIIKTGEIEGVPVKIKIDSYHEGDKIVDLKIMKDFQSIWAEGRGKLPFPLYWGYDIQGAIYQAVEGNNLPFYLAAATKEDGPDLAIIQIPQYYLDTAMANIKSKIVRFQAIKEGIIEPERCEKCNYCKATKVLERVISLEEMEYAE